MLHACVRKFDVAGTAQTFLGTKRSLKILQYLSGVAVDICASVATTVVLQASVSFSMYYYLNHYMNLSYSAVFHAMRPESVVLNLFVVWACNCSVLIY